MTESVVAKFRQEQTLQEQAAQRGLDGYALVSRHDFIEARMERGAERLLELIDKGKHEEAEKLMNTPTWGLEEDICDTLIALSPHRDQERAL